MQFYKVKSVEETISIIHKEVKGIKDSVTIPLTEALGAIVAIDMKSAESVPGFTRSTVDGYAIIAKEIYGSSESMPAFLQVIGEVKMGDSNVKSLHPGEAIFIPTGGMLPIGSDSVIMIEYCEDIEGLLNTYRQVAPGENIITAGEDVEQGEILLQKGTKLRAQEIGILGAIGVTQVQVFRKVKVGYISSGDEIVPYHTKDLKPGEIRDINQLTISALAQEWGAEVISGGIVSDQYDRFLQKAREIADQVDFLVISGGSSVGEKDFTTEVIQSLGQPGVLVHGVSVKPGKPTIFGMAGNKPILGLPGHPASAAVIFMLFGEATIKLLQGEKTKERPETILARVVKNIPSSPGRTDYIRVSLEEKNGEWWAFPVLGKSGLLSTLVQSDGLIYISSEKEGVREGDWVPVILFQ